MDNVVIKKRVVGVDVSVERTTYAIVDIRGNIIAHDSFNTLDFPDVNGFIEQLSEGIIGLAENNGGYETIRSVGISVPSGNQLTGCVENAPNLPWKGVVPMAAMLRDRIGLAVALANDAHVIALGENVFGSAHGMEDFIVVSLGHGIGSCFFSRGYDYLGEFGFSGEIGHTCVVDHGRHCECGLDGCMETYCAAKGIIRTAKEMMAESDEPSLMRSYDRLTPKIICECCEQGDEMAIEVFRRTGKILGLALANYASVIDPEAFIFTGGISKAGHWLLDPAEEEFEKHVYYNIRGKVKFLVSMLDDRERDVLGASVLAWEIKEYSLFK